MTSITKLLPIAAGVAALTTLASPASAQVAGVATANPTVAIAKTKALLPTYRTIETSYATYLQQIQAKNKEVQDLLAKLDTNGDKNVDQAEMDTAQRTNAAVITQIEGKQRELQQLRAPVVKAQIYVISQIVDKFEAAQQAVVTAKKLNYILAPDAFVYAPPAIDVTDAIAAELDRLAPTLNPTPPADWQPEQQDAQMYQQVQQLLSAAAQVQAQRTQAGAAPAAAQPAGR